MTREELQKQWAALEHKDISKLDRQKAKEPALKIIRVQLFGVNKYFGDRAGMNVNLLPELARRVYESFHHWNEADLNLICTEIMDGKHPSNKHPDPTWLMGVFHNYDNRRSATAEGLRGAESQKAKEAKVEIDAEVFEEGIKKVMEAWAAAKPEEKKEVPTLADKPADWLREHGLIQQRIKELTNEWFALRAKYNGDRFGQPDFNIHEFEQANPLQKYVNEKLGIE